MSRIQWTNVKYKDLHYDAYPKGQAAKITDDAIPTMSKARAEQEVYRLQHEILGNDYQTRIVQVDDNDVNRTFPLEDFDMDTHTEWKLQYTQVPVVEIGRVVYIDTPAGLIRGTVTHIANSNKHPTARLTHLYLQLEDVTE